MRSTGKCLAVLMAMLLTVGSIPASAFADDETFCYVDDQLVGAADVEEDNVIFVDEEGMESADEEVIVACEEIIEDEEVVEEMIEEDWNESAFVEEEIEYSVGAEDQRAGKCV